MLENKENLGFSKANNQAVKIAKGDYVCILNPDTAVTENTFVEVLKYANSKPNLGALGVYLMDGKGLFLPESKRNLPTPKASFLKLMGWSNSYYATHIAPPRKWRSFGFSRSFYVHEKIYLSRSWRF